MDFVDLWILQYKANKEVLLGTVEIELKIWNCQERKSAVFQNSISYASLFSLLPL